MRKLICLVCIFVIFSVRAEDIKVIDAFYRYPLPDNCSHSEAKAIAMDRAIAEALEREYGSKVQSETWSEVHSSEEDTRTDIWRIGSSMVKGQWIETIGEPKFTFVTDGNSVVLEVRMRGRTMATSDRNIDLDINTICVNKEGKLKSQRFQSGDRLEVNFTSPIDGYLLMFLGDDEGGVSQLLPFPNQKTGALTIAGGERYDFFRSNRELWEEQYRLTTDKEIERNILYVIFTPNHIIKPVAALSNGIRSLSVENFREWLSKQRSIDKDVQIRTIPLTVIN